MHYTPYFHEMCGWGIGSLATPGHLHTKLHRRLFDSSSIRAVSSSTSRCRSRSHERLRVKAKRKEKCASSSTEDHLSGIGGEGFDHDAVTSVSCSYWVDPRDSQESERRPVTHCEAFSKAVGSDGSCLQRDHFWPAAHETLAVVAQDHRVFSEGQPILHNQGHAAMLTGLRHVEETMVPVTRHCVGGSMSSRNANDGRLPHGLGRSHKRSLRPRSVGRFPSHEAHQLPEDAGSFSSVETLFPRPERPSCASTHKQYVGGLLHQPPGGSALAPLYRLARQILLWAQGKLLSLRAVYIPGYLNQGADILSRQELRPGEWMLHTEVLEHFWKKFRWAQVCVSRDLTMSPLVLSDSSSSPGAGCDGTDVAEASSVRLPPDCSALGSSGERHILTKKCIAWIKALDKSIC